jgi:hypothetical protein
MIKLATLIALLGLSSAQVAQWWSMTGPQNQGFSYPDDGTYADIYDGDHFNVKHFFETNAGWGSLYQGSSMTNADMRSESYGIQLWSYARYQLVADCGTWFSTTMELSLEPVYAAPYIQTVHWSRFEANNGFSLSLEGSREVRAMDYELNVSENYGTTQQSFFEDMGSLDLADFTLDDAFANDIEDTRYSGNLIELIDSDIVADLHQKEILGVVSYYTADIVE